MIIFWQLRQLRQFWKDSPGDLWHLRHWLQFWQLSTWIHDNLCYLTIKSETGQHSQFLRCFNAIITFSWKFYCPFCVCLFVAWVGLCLLSCSPFDDTFENAHAVEKSQINDTSVILRPLRQAIWCNIWKCTVKKSQTIWGNNWKRTVEKG